MAPTTSKPSRPSFSPPRPWKSKATKSSKEKAVNANTKGKATTRRKSNGDSKTGESSTSRVHKSKPRAKTTQNGAGKDKVSVWRSGGGRKKQRGAGGTMRAFLDEEASATEEEDEDSPRRRGRKPREQEEDGVLNEFVASMDTDGSDVDGHRGKSKRNAKSGDDDQDDNEDEDEEPEDEDEEETADLDERLNMSSPEPDFILAEVTQPSHQNSAKSSSKGSDYAIPLPLLHRIMHASFTNPSRTILAADARDLVGKYMEIFVKEAVRRCVDEKKERVQQGEPGDVGWLEVEDLERVGSQLVLDF